MIGEEYYVGDVVRVRQWDDMEKEFGTNFFGSIKVAHYFSTIMARFCGTDVTIRKAYPNTDEYLVEENGFLWSSGMFESFNAGDDVDVASFYNG